MRHIPLLYDNVYSSSSPEDLSQKIHKKDISFENKINDFTQKLLNKNTRIEVLDREISEN